MQWGSRGSGVFSTKINRPPSWYRQVSGPKGQSKSFMSFNEFNVEYTKLKTFLVRHLDKLAYSI